MIPGDHDHRDPLEARLRALRPTGLPSQLQDRLLAVEPPPVRHRALRLLPFVGALAVTAMILLLVALTATRHVPLRVQASTTKPSAAPPAPSDDYRVFVPSDQRSTLLGVSEGEIVDAGTDRPVRLVRAVWLDDTTYVGADHLTMHRRTTRAEIVPVALENL